MPQPFEDAVMTDAGAALLTRAQAGETRIEFTRIAIGDGSYSEEEREPGTLQGSTGLKSARNSYALSGIEISGGRSVKVTALITNQDPITGAELVEEGYFINEIGLYAKEKGGEGSTEALYSIAVTSGEHGDFMPPYNGHNPVQIIQDYYATVSSSAEVTVQAGAGAAALADDLAVLGNSVSGLLSDVDAAYGQANAAYAQANNAYNAASSADRWDDSSVSLGHNAYAAGGGGVYSTAVGYFANASGSSSTALGISADASGSVSIALGSGANASGSVSIALGNGANASGSYSAALGSHAAASGANAVALGYNVKATGSNSAAIGWNAAASGNYSTALGSYATASGANSIALGNSSKATSSISTALGSGANASGSASTALGSNAKAIGNYCTAVGSNAKAGNIVYGASATIAGNYSASIGYNSASLSDYSTALGSYAVTSNANSIQLGNASTLSSITAKVALTVTSDERDKADITEVGGSAVGFLKKIHAIRYVFNGREMYIDEESLTDGERAKKAKFGLCAYDKAAHAAGTKKGSRVRVGVSAQEVQRALQDAYGDAGYANLVNDSLFDYAPEEIPDGVESQLAVNYEGFIPFLVKAVQELDGRLSALEPKGGGVTA